MNIEKVKKQYSYSRTFCVFHDGFLAWSKRLYGSESMSIYNGKRLGCEWKNGLFRAEYEIDGKYKYGFEIKNGSCDICEKISKANIFNENSENRDIKLQQQVFVVMWYMEILKRNGTFNQKDDFIESEVMECHFMDSNQKHLILNTAISNYSEQYIRKQLKEVVNRI
jgi:hypothetical protein